MVLTNHLVPTKPPWVSLIQWFFLRPRITPPQHLGQPDCGNLPGAMFATLELRRRDQTSSGIDPWPLIVGVREKIILESVIKGEKP
jgi:hypothetical protein